MIRELIFVGMFLLTSISLISPQPAMSQDTATDRDSSLLSANYFERMLEATLADGERGDVVFTVEGIVQDADGKPVPNAIVVLCEGSTQRISSMAKQLEMRKIGDTPIYMIDDIFARTRADENGRYEFKEIVAPKVGRIFHSRWNWSVAASSASGDFGWLQLKQSYVGPTKVTKQADVTLRRSKPISGTLLSKDGKPIAGVLVQLGSIDRIVPSQSYLPSSDRFDVNGSSFGLYQRTDETGSFLFSAAPENVAFQLHLFNGENFFDSYRITSANVSLKQRQSSIMGTMRRPAELIISPATIREIPTVLVRGRVVGEKNKPVAGARVRVSSTSVEKTTDTEGKFEWTTTEAALRQTFAEDGMVRFYPTSDSGEFVREATHFPVEDLLLGDELKLVLRIGCEVTGRVVCRQTDEPIAGVSVEVNYIGAIDDHKMLHAWTDKNGEFQVIARPTRIAIGIHGQVAGYALPRRSWQSGLETESKFVRHVELTGKQSLKLDDFVVDALPSIRVKVVDEDDAPVVQATVKGFYQQESAANGRLGIDRDLADPAVTDASGQCRLLPKVDSWSRVTVHAEANIAGQRWYGMQTVDNHRNDRAKIKLQHGWKLSGRVLMNDKPVPNANVILKRKLSTGVEPHKGVKRLGFSMLKYIDATTTDQHGRYSFEVAPNESYSISVTNPDDAKDVKDGLTLDKVSHHEYQFRDIDF
ncbi:MAG: hypothetical protein WBD20_17425 [Pirellulaceae bacterium]